MNFSPDFRPVVVNSSDGTVIWEGHAQTANDAAAPDAQANAEAAKLANAIFRDFPGESGRTITVR